MQNIWLLIVLILQLIPIYQLNAQSDQAHALSETSTQSPEPTINTSTTTSHETSPVREMLDELIFKYEIVYFESASYHLSPKARQILKRKAKWIKSQDFNKQVLVIGHCDQRGSESNNKYLGALRAHSVKQFLINCGIDKSRVHILSAGETQPLSQAENKTALAKNRRVEVIVRCNFNTADAFQSPGEKGKGVVFYFEALTTKDFEKVGICRFIIDPFF